MTTTRPRAAGTAGRVPRPPAAIRLAGALALAAAMGTLAACGASSGDGSDSSDRSDRSASRGATPLPPTRVDRRQVPGGDAERGRRLFGRYQCGACHVIPDAAGGLTPHGPPLAAWGVRSTLAGVLRNDAATLQRWLQDPPALVPATPMPRLGVGPQDARDLAAALMAMR